MNEGTYSTIATSSKRLLSLPPAGQQSPSHVPKPELISSNTEAGRLRSERSRLQPCSPWSNFYWFPLFSRIWKGKPDGPPQGPLLGRLAPLQVFRERPKDHQWAMVCRIRRNKSRVFLFLSIPRINGYTTIEARISPRWGSLWNWK